MLIQDVTFSRPFVVLRVLFYAVISSAWATANDSLLEDSRVAFLRQHCFDCHTGSKPEGDLDLSLLGQDITDEKSFATWVRVHDQVQAKEMPPKGVAPVDPGSVELFVASTREWLVAAQLSQQQKKGRVQARRLTNLQLERTLQDLLGIDIPLASEMPDEPQREEFSTHADLQSMSHFHLEQHLKVVDLALDEAFRRVAESTVPSIQSFTAKDIARTRDVTREPELIDDQAVIWSSRLIFYGRIPATTAKQNGWYRVAFQVSSLKKPNDRGVWCTVRTGKCISSAPLLGWVGAFEAMDEPKVVTMDAWLPKGHMLEIRPGDQTLQAAKFQGGQSRNGEGGSQDVPGIAIDWLTLEQVHHGPDQATIRQSIFGSEWSDAVASDTVDEVAGALMIERILNRFAQQAFRRPVSNVEVGPYVRLSHRVLKEGKDFKAALRSGLRAILCAPRFLYFQEPIGKLDDFAIASRLSYLLWSSMPDEKLFALATAGKLGQTTTIRSEVDRMLRHPHGQRFVRDFSAQWLDLSEIDFTEPDGKLYPNFDIIIQNSMLEETHRYLQALIQENLGVTHLVDSDFTYLNSRLAQHYRIQSVFGDEMRRVSLSPQDNRGGLLAHGSVLKVTANGSSTSPTLRGVWVCRRIIGEAIPPPPESVPAIEPDIRGTKTIRQQLERHRSESACSVCHVKIDPPGFALENFDPVGRWRDRYLRIVDGKLKSGDEIDASDVMQDGQTFKGFEEFKRLVAAKPAELARNLADQVLIYGTGAPISFADRGDVQKIVEQVSNEGYGIRSIIKAAVTSRIFLMK